MDKSYFQTRTKGLFPKETSSLSIQPMFSNQTGSKPGFAKMIDVEQSCKKSVARQKGGK